jgi:DNA processing protein
LNGQACMSDLILLSYLFSLLPKANLDEFFKLADLLRRGLRLRDKEFLKSSYLTKNINLDHTFLRLLDVWQEAIERAIDQGVNLTFPGQPDFPESLLLMQEPVYFLTYFGAPIWQKKPCFSVVGSREPAQLSEQWCEEVFPSLMNRLPLCLVSGGARGVDQIVHRIALRLSAPTVIVLPSGILQMYPEQLSDWKNNIFTNGGAFISEFLPSRKMQKHYFHQRNRLIAGISFATLIIEARRKSGTMITARHATEQGKPLFVLPSHPLDTRNQGALDLLIDGATPVRDAEDLYIYICSELSAVKWRSVALGGCPKEAP